MPSILNKTLVYLRLEIIKIERVEKTSTEMANDGVIEALDKI